MCEHDKSTKQKLCWEENDRVNLISYGAQRLECGGSWQVK